MDLWALVGIVFLAFLIEASLGFGATVVTVTLGAMLVPLGVLLPAFIPLNVLLSTYLVFRYQRTTAWPLLLTEILPYMLLGMPVGMAVFYLGHERPAKMAFGVFVTALAGLELLRMKRTPVRTPLPTASKILLLLAGGIVHGAFAAGGPMAVYVTTREIGEKTSFRSTLAVLWFILNFVLLVSYGFSGALTAETLRLSATMSGPLVAGLVAGEWAHRHVDEKVFRVLVYVVLAAAGCTLLAHA